MLFGEVGVFGLFLNFHFVFVLIVRHVGLPFSYTLIELVSRFIIPITLANTWLGA